MSTRNYDRSIALVCPQCEAKKFQQDDDLAQDDVEVTCAGCRTTFTIASLRHANKTRVEPAVEDLGKQVVLDAATQLNRTIKRLNRR